MISPRFQQTLKSSVSLSGVGFFTGADVTIRFRPAPENHGIVFQRTDLPGAPLIPALIENVLPMPRRTAIGRGEASVQMIEHVMAALAGLQIDNCLVQLDGPEPPGTDGSSWSYVRLLQKARIQPERALRKTLVVDREVTVQGRHATISASPSLQSSYEIRYNLDYGAGSPIPRQSASCEITPGNFHSQLAPCRTFVLESEVQALQAQGIGTRLSAKDVLVFGEQGVIGNSLRMPNECARHKLLDCVGDFALAGCDLIGQFHATCSGHELNQELVRAVIKACGHPSQDATVAKATLRVQAEKESSAA